MAKPVALILLNWNTAQHTITCISSILAHCDTSYFDVILTDNGSTDDSLEQIKGKFPDLTYIHNKKNLGFAEGNNQALRYSLQHQYQYSLLLNTDTVVHEDIILPMLRHLDTARSVGAVQPAIYWLHEPDKLWNGGSYFNPYLGITYSQNGSSTHQTLSAKEVDWVTGCCFMVRNELLKNVGLFNSRFFLYYEDVDLSLRLKQAGYRLDYLSSVCVFHEAGVSGKLPSRTNEGTLSPIIHYYLCRNKFWFLRRYANPLCLPIIILGNLGYYLVLLFYFTIRKRWKKATYLLAGIKEGMTVKQSAIWNSESS